jgi:hypothetical protein
VTARYRFVGITDECVECQQCGKPNLHSTVVLSVLDAEGNHEEYTYYGSTCAARALGETGRGAASRVLGLARAAHRKLVAEAFDARRMLASYGLPETGEPTSGQVSAAMQLYNERHWNVCRLVEETGIGVRARVLDMTARYQAALAKAAHVGATVPANDQDLLTFLASI